MEEGAAGVYAPPYGSSLSVSFDAASCSGGSPHHILYGQRTGFPAVPGCTFTLLGSVCSIGNTGPYSWSSIPAPTDGTPHHAANSRAQGSADCDA
ncbi:MAG TPA: hypothetical protein VFW45_13815 [Candidatus Polarisedimenticolia bacterium]|nr:hypothetical protein [Candidatus Polarisedimenticolia bacterium]